MSDGYRKQRNLFGNYGGGLLVTPFIGQSTLVPAKTLHTIWLQRVHVHVASGLAGVTWSIEDSAGNKITGDLVTTPSPTQDPIAAEFDFGPEGVPLTAGSNLLFIPSATGARGTITWDAYQKLSSTSGFGS